MSSTDTGPIGIVCDDRPAMRRTIISLLTRSGFSVGGEVAHYQDLHDLVLDTAPTLAIVTLPTPGLNGLTAITALHLAAPTTELVLLSAFGSLDLPAREAGALALVPEDNLGGLQAVLLDLGRRWQADRLAHVSLASLISQRTYNEPTRDKASPSDAA